MAKMPSENEVREALADTGKALADKASQQALEGKEFKVDSRVGVIPEEIWQQHKSAGQEQG